MRDFVDLQDSIARDFRAAWADSTTAYQRLSVTDQLLQQANLALDLAQAPIQAGPRLDRRAQSGAAQPDAGRDRTGQRQV